MQWRTIELGTVWKSPSKQLLRRTLLLRTIFCSALGSSRRPPTSPSNVVAKKSTHFHPFCSQFNFVWSGRGGVASFSNITGKVQTLLTSIVATPLLLVSKQFYTPLQNTTASFAVFNHPSLVLHAVSFCGPDVAGMVPILVTCKRTENRQNHSFGDNTRFIYIYICFSKGLFTSRWVPQVGEVTACPYNLPYGHPIYHVTVLKLKWEIIWTGGLPYLPGVPHLHVTGP